MLTAFTVKGISPLNGEVVEMVVLAETAMDAKSQAEACGLRFVVVSEYTPRDRRAPPTPP